MPTITTLRESVRGCGYRKAGGLYLVTDGLSAACGLLPIPLTVCPTCHGGIKPSRGWTWIQPQALFGEEIADKCYAQHCASCPISIPNRFEIDRAGLLWIGGSFYERPSDWLVEAQKMGVSRRISAVPRDFVVGETWVYIAHRKAIERQPWEDATVEKYTPGIIGVVCPQRLEYVVTGDETAEELAAKEARGITLVKVEQV